MLQVILRVVRVAAVLTILAALSGYGSVRPAMAGPGEEDGPRCEKAEVSRCLGVGGFWPESQCTGLATPCTTCMPSVNTCSGHGGYRVVE